MKIALYSASSDLEITTQLLERIAVALEIQSSRDLGGWWEVSPVPISVFTAESVIPNDHYKCGIKDEIPEAPDALAYHTIDSSGRPKLVIGWGVLKSMGGTLIEGGNSLSVSISHELCETIMDPYIDFWSDFDAKREVALEVCDPVEGDAYDIDGISVSNFIGPRWFSEGPGPYDYMKKLTTYFQMSPGGYMVLRTGGPSGALTQVYGEAMPEAKRILKAKHSRRVHKREGRPG